MPVTVYPSGMAIWFSTSHELDSSISPSPWLGHSRRSPKPRASVLNHMAMPLGQTVTGMWTWDLMRLIDHVETRPECDASRIGCAGLSGGGLRTLWLAALDERIRCAVVSGYFYRYRESLLLLWVN